MPFLAIFYCSFSVFYWITHILILPLDFVSFQVLLLYNKLVKSGEDVRILFALGDGINDICYTANVLEIVSDRDAIKCPGEQSCVPYEFRGDETARIWIKISAIREESTIKAAMLRVRSTDANLKQVISNSQFHFGYVYLPKSEVL